MEVRSIIGEHDRLGGDEDGVVVMAVIVRMMAWLLGVGVLMMTMMMVGVMAMALRVTNHPPVLPGLSWL